MFRLRDVADLVNDSTINFALALYLYSLANDPAADLSPAALAQIEALFGRQIIPPGEEGSYAPRKERDDGNKIDADGCDDNCESSIPQGRSVWCAVATAW